METYRVRIKINKAVVLEVVTTHAPHLDEETEAQRGNSRAQGHTAAGPGLLSRAFVLGLRLRNAEHGDQFVLRRREKIKNKTRAGCASLLVHLAASQLKGESGLAIYN